jgi:hypothetical protein
MQFQEVSMSIKVLSILPSGLWDRVLYLAPVVVALLWGAWWIAAHAYLARGFVHPLFQSLALAENVTALLLRRRKPVGALAGILVVYGFVALDPTTFLPVLIALFTVTVVSSRRVAAWAIIATTLLVIATPFIHKESIDVLEFAMVHLTAIGLVAAAGQYWRSRQVLIPG